MDNPTKDPQGDEDVTSSEGQSQEVETQPESQEESAPAEESKEQESTPWESDPKFKGKTAEDIYKSYRELEKKTGELGQKAKLADLIQEKYGLTPEQFQERVEAQAQEEQEQIQQENPEAYIQEKLKRQEEELALLKEERELDNFLQENPDFKEHREQLLKIALNLEPNKPYSDIAQEYLGKAIEQGKKSAYEKIETKKVTQATDVSQSEQKVKPSLEDLQNMSVDELEKMLPHASEE